MGSIPPNGAVTVTITVFDGANNALDGFQKTINIPCHSVPQAKSIGAECVREIEDLKAQYERESGKSAEK